MSVSAKTRTELLALSDQAIAVANQMTDTAARATLFVIAAGYYRLAVHVADRTKKGLPPDFPATLH